MEQQTPYLVRTDASVLRQQLMTLNERQRHVLLQELANVEEFLDVYPTVKQLRDWWKTGQLTEKQNRCTMTSTN